MRIPVLLHDFADAYSYPTMSILSDQYKMLRFK